MSAGDGLVHRRECNTHSKPFFYSENQTMTAFSYTRFPVNKINVEKFILKLRENSCLIILSISSDLEIGKFQGVTNII
jgi:hypothetical protein